MSADVVAPPWDVTRTTVWDTVRENDQFTISLSLMRLNGLNQTSQRSR
jgi:hypothetical protein